MRFRCGKNGPVTDIKQAFLQIEVNLSQRDFSTADNPSIVAFRFTRILFGLNSSPFILEETLQSIIEKHCDITPDENIENRRSKRLAGKNANIMNKLMFEQ